MSESLKSMMLQVGLLKAASERRGEVVDALRAKVDTLMEDAVSRVESEGISESKRLTLRELLAENYREDLVERLDHARTVNRAAEKARKRRRKRQRNARRQNR